MKKIFSKILILLLLFLVLFDFVCYNESQAFDMSFISKVVDYTSRLGGGFYSIVIWIKRIEIIAVAYALNKSFYSIAMTDNTVGVFGSFGNITPFAIFFNKFKLLDINLFDINSHKTGSLGYLIRKNVAVWFYTTRLISSGLLLAILVYVGIRMALSTVSSDKAVYKKMLVDWCVSLILIFCLPYLMIFIININAAVVNSFESLSTGIVDMDNINNIHGKIALLAVIGTGIPSITATITYCALTFITIGFFIAYINRLIKVAFLIIISPLISITYSIDKMKDKKAQAFDTWFKEFAYTILIQPFHCVIYLTFINTSYSLLLPFINEATNIPARLSKLNPFTVFTKNGFMSNDMNLVTNAVFVILSLIFIKQAEEIIRKIFGFSDDNKSTSFGAGMAMSLMAVSQAKNIGTQTRKAVNKFKNFPTKFGTAIEKDLDKFRNTEIGKKVNKKLENINEKVSKTANKFNENNQVKKAKKFATDIANSKQMRKASEVKQKITGATSKIGKKGKELMDKGAKFTAKIPKPVKDYLRKKNSIASVVGMMYGISQVMNGDMPLEAYADSVAVEQGIDAFLNSGEGKLAERAEYSATELDKIEYASAVKEYKSHADPNSPDTDPLEAALKKTGHDSIEMYREQVQINKEANNGKSYAEQASEKRAQAKELEEEGNKKLKSSGKTPGTDTNEELEQAAKLEKEARKLDKLAKEEAYLEALAAQKDFIVKFYSREAIVERTKERSAPPTKKEMKDASKAFKEFITDLISERNKINKGTEGYSTLEDEKTAKAIQESIEEIIKVSIGAEKEVDYSKLLEDRLDIKRQDDPEQYATAMQMIDNLRQLHLQKSFSEIFEPLYNVDGDEDRLGAELAKKMAR